MSQPAHVDPRGLRVNAGITAVVLALVLLTDIASKVHGVVTVDIDAEEHLEMVRRFGIMRTPTVLVLDAEGVVSTRASGLPRREQVLAALGQAVGDRR